MFQGFNRTWIFEENFFNGQMHPIFLKDIFKNIFKGGFQERFLKDKSVKDFLKNKFPRTKNI